MNLKVKFINFNGLSFFMNLSSMITGIFMFIIGALLLIFIKPFNYTILILSIVLFALGLYMIFNSDKEDKIEQIKR